MSSAGLIVDLFAGGGGASIGIERALGRPIDLAVNHNAAAIAVHRANHPSTRHALTDVWEVAPKDACGSRRVRLLWASPTCTHFSKARGSAPKSPQERTLAWTVVRWARDVRPDTIIVENVEEFEDWGPLGDDGQPIRERAGDTFRAWVAKISSYGYEVSFRRVVAADHGAPTTRRRIFVVARRRGSGAPAWPDPTHGVGRSAPWRTAAEVIDWGLPCPSIFGRKKPLAEATQRRIAAGLRRYVLEAERPFLIGSGGAASASFIDRQFGASRGAPVTAPLGAVTAGGQGKSALVSPLLMPLTHQGADRAWAVTSPMRTVTAANRGEIALVAGFLTKHFGKGVYRQDLHVPLATVTAREHLTASAVWLEKFYGSAHAGAPVPTITASGRGGGHIAACRAFLTKFYGASGRPETQVQGVDDPLHTVTTKARYGLVTIAGEPWEIVDIGLRMLTPRELFRAQGFPEEYEIDVSLDGRQITKTDQIRLAGNSVCPPVAEALVRAQYAGAGSVAA